MLLSILIPSLVSRNKKLDALCNSITFQMHQYMLGEKIDFGVFELLCQIDNGEMSIGQKRNELLDSAKGEYLCFIDDDDTISADYIELVLKGIKTKPDCCSLNGLITTDGGNPKAFVHSIKHNNWYEENNIYYRPPNHLNCIKSQIAKQFKFPLTNSGEDADWSMQIAKSGLLKTESEIKETIYYYDYISNK
jgi:glycosyltransferase involved in cell wall biosynthesis